MEKSQPSQNQSAVRHLPHDVEIEQCVLGVILTDEAACIAALDALQPEDFYDPVHQRLWGASITMAQDGRSPKPLTLGSAMGHDESFKELGGARYLQTLAMARPAMPNVGEYCRILQDLSLRRKAIGAAEDLVNTCFNASIDGSALDIVTDHESALYNLIHGRKQADDPTMLYESTSAAVDRLSRPKGENNLLTTGVPEIDDWCGGFGPGDLVIIGARTGMGKEQPVDTPTLTPNGWVPLGNIRPGDLIYGQNGRPTKVLAVHPQGMKPAYRVSFRDGSSVECGREHLWAVASRDSRSRTAFRVMPLKDLLALGLTRKKVRRFGARWRVPICEPIQFKTASLPIHPYVLGVLLGDGSISGKDLRFSNPDFDADIRARVASHLPPGMALHMNRSGACPYFDLRGTGRRAMREEIKSLGLNVRSGQKFVPDIYKFAAIDQRMELLRGLMDTDGSCIANRTVFYTTSRHLADDVCTIVRSLGGVSSIRKYDRSKSAKPTEYVVVVKMSEVPFCTRRKAAAWSPHTLSRYITKVEYSRDTAQVCITVAAKDGLYLTKDYIVTHNTAMALLIGHNVAATDKGVLFTSLEMGRDQLAERWLSMRAYADGEKIPYSKLRRSDVDDFGRNVLARASSVIGQMPLWIDQRRGQRLSQIGMRARRVRAQMRKDGTDLGLLIIDHLQLIEPEGRYRGNKAAETGEISRSMKVLAASLGVPILCLSQLNRGVESREDKRPFLSDLRESGAIEEDADAVMLLYRPEYYAQQNPPDQRKNDGKDYASWENNLMAVKGDLTVFGVKNRHGSHADLKMSCDIAYNWIGPRK